MRAPALLGFAAAVALGLATGTGAGLVLHRPDAESAVGAPPDSGKKAAADSARHPSDSASAAKAQKPKPSSQVPAPKPPVVLPSPRPPVAQPIAAKPPAPDTAALNRAAALKSARERLAKMFSAMEPKGAAAVLEQLSDGEVAKILGVIPERQAGAILEYFTPERAAAVSRALLNSSRSTS